ncbi:MAG TPA: Fic family protein [Victivallales bacterium]|nr:Fic family protein [Victivallales bacterium]
MNFEKVDKLKEKLDKYRPLSPDIVKNLHEELVLKWTYNSNAIEGNTLTLKETKVALEGITIGGKTIREHFEAINHKQAILFIEDLVNRKESLTEWNIKLIHQLILKNIDDKSAGAYRNINVTISGAKHMPPEFIHLHEEMQHFINWYKNEGKELHPVERAVRVHVDFVKIHPFVDGNGRTSRLLMNFELMKDGFPALIIPVKKRLEYYETLDLAHTKNNYNPFLEMILELVESSFNPYWFALGIKNEK